MLWFRKKNRRTPQPSQEAINAVEISKKELEEAKAITQETRIHTSIVRGNVERNHLGGRMAAAMAMKKDAN